jgi:hypothetical protein
VEFAPESDVAHILHESFGIDRLPTHYGRDELPGEFDVA